MKEILELLLQKPCLTASEAENAMGLMLEGANAHQAAAFLAILKYRGEKPAELAGMAAAAQKKAFLVQAPFPVMDIVGTGGKALESKACQNFMIGPSPLLGLFSDDCCGCCVHSGG